ncbi:GNAT family N-acetyltransferase [Salipiger sp. PrR002]|uniref:GNAT family N-acetyltransferase n=1 Tax=Salipiger sp. PrR002 TaxID=2706489 RepID=UPI001F378B7C|nr:GNAT family N-acetyltransferase [Salipiger sp. PrR002]
MMLRTMTKADLGHALDWAAKEGWNPGLEDLDPFYAADPEGFFCAELGGNMAAAISVVNHTDSLAFLGLYLCAPAYRGQGIAHALWLHAMKHAGDRTIGLDGVPAQQENYRKSGFVLAGQTKRFAGRLSRGPGKGVQSAAADEHAALIAMEAKACGYAKPRFTAAWLEPAQTRFTLVHREAGKPNGFLTLRGCHEGWKIGPLCAPDLTVAQALLEAAAAHTGEDQVMIDLPAESAALAAHCLAMGMQPVFHTARMYRGPAPLAGRGQNAVGTLELG